INPSINTKPFIVGSTLPPVKALRPRVLGDIIAPIGPTKKRPSRNANYSIGEIPNEPLFTIQSPRNSYQSPYTSTLTPPPPPRSAQNNQHNSTNPRPTHTTTSPTLVASNTPGNHHHHTPKPPRSSLSKNQVLPLSQTGVLNPHPTIGHRQDSSERNRIPSPRETNHKTEFRLTIEPLFDCHRELRVIIESQPSAQTIEMVDRALNAHDKNQDLSPEDLLCRTFAIITKTEGTENLFKEGLDRLTETALSIIRPEGLAILI
ncbi:hypothetical protein BKA66DRAFT_479984, partial [Pyrenochaeta sp. MPI-SDFR-AT-0127]